MEDSEREQLQAYLLTVEAALRDCVDAFERSKAARETRDIAELDRLDPILSELRGRFDILLRNSGSGADVTPNPEP